MATILVVEDDKNTRILTMTRLKNRFEILEAEDGEKALDIIYNKHIDLIVADVMMPKMDGYELIKTIREDGNKTPVIFLTAKQAFEDKKEGFLLGIDDYLTKPVNYDELIWRIDALLRRTDVSTENKIQIGDLVVDNKNYMVTYKENIIELSKKEFELLYKLISYPNKVFTKVQLLDEIWGYETESMEETIKTHMSKLRNKLNEVEDIEIVTLKGFGYKLQVKEQKNYGK